MGANSVKSILKDSQRSGFSNVLVQTASRPAQALKRQKGKKKTGHPRFRKHPAIEATCPVSAIFFPSAGNFLILALCQGCQFFLA